MISSDTIRELYEIGQHLVKLNRQFEFPEVNAGGDLLKVLSAGINCMTAAEDVGIDTVNLRKSAHDSLRSLDSELLGFAQAAKGNPSRADRIQSLRKSVQRQIAMNQACTAERKELRVLAKAIDGSEAIVKTLSIVAQQNNLRASDLREVRGILRTNLGSYRKRLTELVHGPLPIQALADSLSQRCDRLLRSEIVSGAR